MMKRNELFSLLLEKVANCEEVNGFPLILFGVWMNTTCDHTGIDYERQARNESDTAISGIIESPLYLEDLFTPAQLKALPNMLNNLNFYE